jgi:hypothetical protein
LRIVAALRKFETNFFEAAMTNGKSKFRHWAEITDKPKPTNGGTAMSEHGTASEQVVPGWYVELQLVVLRAMPRDIPREVADRWKDKGELLAAAMRSLLLLPKNEHEIMAEKAQTVIDALEGSRSANPEFPIAIDYGMGVEKLVMLGQYNWSNNDITSKHFSTKQTGKVDITIELVHFGRNISSKEAIKELDRMGLRPAEACELLKFGEKYPDVQREFLINALGSVWRYLDGYRNVVCLGGSGAGRFADLRWLESGWFGSWRFAAVRK